LLVLRVLVLKDDEERPAKKDDDDTKLAAANILFNSCKWNIEEFG
jgi:hypothetical protein